MNYVSEIVTCDVCGKECNGERGLKVHKAHKHKVPKKNKNKVVCEICNKEFKSKTGYLSHFRSKHKLSEETMDEISDKMIEQEKSDEFLMLTLPIPKEMALEIMEMWIKQLKGE